MTYAVCLPLERWRPVERWPDRRAVTVDVLYTLLSRVGILPLFTFVLFYQAQVALTGWMADHGMVPPMLETVFPFLLGRPVRDLRLLRRHSGLPPTTGAIACRTGCAGGGRCTRCITRRRR